MTIDYLVEKYKSKPWHETSAGGGKLSWPINYIAYENVNEFNEIYNFARDNYTFCNATPSGAFPYGRRYKYYSRFIVCQTKVGFELCLATRQGCFRFILRNGKLPVDNNISGRKALMTIYDIAEQFNVKHVFEDNAVDSEEGQLEKKQIEPPLIKVVNEDYLGKEFDNCHHIDANSSYASRIAEVYKELKPMYDYIYSKRKENNGYFKHVLTNSIGCMQSKYCVDPSNGFKTKPYALSKFAKIAINGNNRYINNLLLKLVLSGRKPLLINTDGIWYQGDVYHDRDEGIELGEWKTDHSNCKLYIKSSGAYQFIENNKVNSVVRGYTQLDLIKDRQDWEWREIDKYPKICVYRFDIEKGVYKEWEE